MTPQDFENALRRGLGRAVLHLEQNDTTPYRAAILHACCADLRYDALEEKRDAYLFDVLHATGEPEYYLPLLQQALRDPDTGEYVIGQLMALIARFARQGDRHVAEILYDTFARNITIYDHATGAEHLIPLDGIAGYQFVARYLAVYPLPEEDQWQHTALLNELKGRSGSPP